MSQHARKSRVGHDRWLVSYADFITLLFGFFVVMYAFAKADQKKQVQVSAAIDAAFRSLGFSSATASHPFQAPAGGAEPDMPVNVVMGEDLLAPAAVKNDLERIRSAMTQTLANEVASHTVSIQMGRDGLVISLREAGFFDSGSATPKPEALPTLRRIAGLLGRTAYDVRIEGHTDNIPIHNSQFDSNWELSTARATHIARLFLDLQAISPEHLSAAGYAEFHPVASNDTPEGRAENRRVDLVVVPRTQINFAAPNAPPSPSNWRKITDDE